MVIKDFYGGALLARPPLEYTKQGGKMSAADAMMRSNEKIETTMIERNSYSSS